VEEDEDEEEEEEEEEEEGKEKDSAVHKGTIFIAVEGRKFTALKVSILCPNIFLEDRSCKQSSVKMIFV
jgi:hypothetical protein